MWTRTTYFNLSLSFRNLQSFFTLRAKINLMCLFDYCSFPCKRSCWFKIIWYLIKIFHKKIIFFSSLIKIFWKNSVNKQNHKSPAQKLKENTKWWKHSYNEIQNKYCNSQAVNTISSKHKLLNSINKISHNNILYQ